jgi:hypothetical protein
VTISPAARSREEFEVEVTEEEEEEEEYEEEEEKRGPLVGAREMSVSERRMQSLSVSPQFFIERL